MNAAVGKQHAARHGGSFWIGVGRSDQPVEPAGFHNRVVVQEDQVRSGRRLGGPVVAAGESEIHRRGDDPNSPDFGANERIDVRRSAVEQDNDFVRQRAARIPQRTQARLEMDPLAPREHENRNARILDAWEVDSARLWRADPTIDTTHSNGDSVTRSTRW